MEIAQKLKRTSYSSTCKMDWTQTNITRNRDIHRGLNLRPQNQSFIMLSISSAVDTKYISSFHIVILRMFFRIAGQLGTFYEYQTSVMLFLLGCIAFRIISDIIDEVEESIRNSSLLENFKMSELPALHDKCIELVELLVTVVIKSSDLIFCRY